MNESNAEPPDVQFRLDRLVDGELKGEEYRELLASLDERPDGWRHCALAFLEAQALGREIASIRRTAATPVDVSSSSAGARGSQWPTTLLAVAASFLVAFVLGMGLRGWWSATGSTALDNPEVAVPGAAHALPNDATSAEQVTELPEVRPKNERVVNENFGSEAGRLTLVVDAGDGSRGEEIEVSVYPSEDFDSDTFFTDDRGVPPDVVDALNRSGHEVREDVWRLLPVRLEDGRNVIIPIHEVEITPIGGPIYH